MFATHVEEGLNEHGLQKDALVPWWYWKATLKTCSVYQKDGFIPAISSVRANDLERETFRVRTCERVDLGSLTTVEILCRKVAWNVEDFFWIYDLIHSLALADEFGFVGMKQLEQTKSILVTPGSKTMNKGLHDGADVLDERETQQCRYLIRTALFVGQDRPETQYATEESARFMSDPMRATKCMLRRFRKHYSEASVHSWSFPYQEMQREVKMVTEAYWEGELEGLSTTGAWIYFGGYLLETYSSTQQIVAPCTTESEHISTKDVAHALEIRSILAECGKVKRTGQLGVQWPRNMELAACVTGMRNYRGRSSCAQKAWFIGFEPAWRTQRGRPGVEEDFHRVGAYEWWQRVSPRLRLQETVVSLWNVRNVRETNGWFWICVGMVIVVLTVLSGG